MTREEFKQQAEEFASMYVSDYAKGDARVVLDDEDDGEQPTGRIEFDTYGDEEGWSVPVCVGGKNNDELEVYVEDSYGYELSPQNFYVHLWSDAAQTLSRVRDDNKRMAAAAEKHQSQIAQWQNANLNLEAELERVKSSPCPMLQSARRCGNSPPPSSVADPLAEARKKWLAAGLCSCGCKIEDGFCTYCGFPAPKPAAPPAGVLTTGARPSICGERPAAKTFSPPPVQPDDMAEMAAVCDEVALLTPEGVVPVKPARGEAGRAGEGGGGR